jgi:alkanesulfonate monooxygenase SsuD/methylene tetrahydromethanopterin reductase-like flavin-dependent oxidoreductase (luciferase family)
MTTPAPLRTGVVLPTFRDTPDAAFEAAAEAVAAGVDGLFCYDHIWPLGQPERPALAPFPILGALATRFAASPASGRSAGAGRAGRRGGGPFLGPLVARVGLVPNAVLAAQFTALEQLAPGRVIAGLGTGDRLSEEENRAFGIPYAPAVQRRIELVELARELVHAGMTVWVAGGPAGRDEEARASGAALNVWDADPATVAERGAGGELEVTWAGPPPSASPPLGDHVAALRAAGATWAVFGWPVDVTELVAAARHASGVSSAPAGAGS